MSPKSAFLAAAGRRVAKRSDISPTTQSLKKQVAVYLLFQATCRDMLIPAMNGVTYCDFHPTGFALSLNEGAIPNFHLRFNLFREFFLYLRIKHWRFMAATSPITQLAEWRKSLNLLGLHFSLEKEP